MNEDIKNNEIRSDKLENVSGGLLRPIILEEEGLSILNIQNTMVSQSLQGATTAVTANNDTLG